MWRFFMSQGMTDVAIALLVLDWVIRIVFGVRVVLRRSPVGFTLAWLSIILLVPILGALIYLVLGERRLGTRRAKRTAELREPYNQWLAGLSADFPNDDTNLSESSIGLRKQARNATGMPALPGNTLELLDGAEAIFDRMIADLEAATSSIHLEFYIWYPDGRVLEVHDALIRAAQRGVNVRILVDDVGADDFIKHESFERLKGLGIRIEPMLKVGVIRTFFSRIDLRNHRKIVVIDGTIGYLGSHNMTDPDVAPEAEGVGKWVDSMVRVAGPAVEALQVTWMADWEFETYEGIDRHAENFDLKRHQPCGDAVVQVVPSGPGTDQTVIQELILTAIYSAQHKLTLTTPYFIPDDAMIKALHSAATRGVEVILNVPRRPDGYVVKLAGEAYFEQLLEAGVRIARFEGGVLHTKAITVDDEIAMFGSVNLDMRSFYLNFEISVFVYGSDFASRLAKLQAKYLESSSYIELDRWAARPITQRFAQNLSQLLSPLL